MLFRTVSTSNEIAQILELQACNHASSLTAAAMSEQGFVTVRHDPVVLARMNQAAPSVIAKDGDRIAGYALVMPRSFAADVPVLLPMFEMLDELSWQGSRLRENPRWFVMGQICVGEAYRGQGVFDGLYGKMKEVYRGDYDFVVTEVAERNTRSMRVHERAGFETLHTYFDASAGEDWRVVVLDLVER